MKRVLVCCFVFLQIAFSKYQQIDENNGKIASQNNSIPSLYKEESTASVDTAQLKAASLLDTLTNNSASDDTDEISVAELLETARTHYLSALQAQSEGDSATSASEFEFAIQQLNEASYYPEIEENEDFNELTKSVIEDYEKYIASIDSLGPQSSVFALREKLNLEIEKVDITNISIPPSLIPPTSVPLDINEYSKRAIAFFMGKGRSYMENWIYRSGKYFPVMKRIFKEEGLPEELIYLAMAESGLNPTARSWAKAVGMWQFMKYTGSLYGLHSNYWYDERRDFEKATRAAARHMKDLYQQYNNWHLVFVAYNAGAGWVNRGIRRSGSTDYWEMRKKLPRETRNYVPQYIAVTLMAMRPEAFGFDGSQTADSLSFDYVTVDDCVDLGLLADCVGTSLDTLKELNPELTQWCTPPNYKGYQLRVPAGRKDIFAENYANIPDDKKMDFATHVIRRGETLSAVAQKYRVTVAILQDVNKISRRTKLRVGNTLIIPVQSKSVAAIVDAQRKKQEYEEQQAEKRRQTFLASRKNSKKQVSMQKYEPSGRAKITYMVKKNETLGHIAEWFGVRASHIRNWNNLPYGRPIRVGQRLTIWVPEEKYSSYKKIASLSFSEKQKSVQEKLSQRNITQESEFQGSNWIQHQIRRGETLEKIAEKYNVAIADLKQWNKLRSSRIQAGAVLEILNVSDNNQRSEAVAIFSKKNNSPGNSKIVTHIVRKGETLEKIANKYSVTIEEVKRWNNLHGSRISAGQKLKIEG
ncbi:MAG: LysM peptidoglycan-binding domain-containing protein [Bacteroidetes bacterium]|nr:LysM peptidoglycan-binding domain-containing protein [Bacteroidota bacterium]